MGESDLDLGYARRPNESYDQEPKVLEVEDVRLEPELPFPTKLLVVSVTLFVVGGILIFSGFISEIFNVEDKTKGIACWVLGGITFIPGAYYTYLFYRAWRTQNPEERRRIMRELEAVA